MGRRKGRALQAGGIVCAKVQGRERSQVAWVREADQTAMKNLFPGAVRGIAGWTRWVFMCEIPERQNED